MVDNSGYWRIEVDNEDGETTVYLSSWFVSINGGDVRIIEHIEHVKSLKVILSTVKLKYALEYLDNIVLISMTLSGHMKHSKSVLRLVKGTGVALRLEKCI